MSLLRHAPQAGDRYDIFRVESLLHGSGCPRQRPMPGFCHRHMDQLYSQANALGLALMLHSHLKKQEEDLFALLEKQGSSKPAKKIFAKKDAGPSSDPIEAYRQNFIGSCYICKRIDEVFERMLTAFFLLWNKNGEFHRTVEDCKGFCIQPFSHAV